MPFARTSTGLGGRVGGIASSTRSDYFGQLYDWAEQFDPGRAKAYVCDLSGRRGPPRPRGGPQRRAGGARTANRSVEENLDLFRRMKAGEFPDGARTLAGKDRPLSSPKLQPTCADPVHVPHPCNEVAPAHRRQVGASTPDVRLGSHGQSDSIEGITHSICTLEFEKPPAALRTGLSSSSAIFPPAAGRIRPAEPDVHRPQQNGAA